MRRWLNIAVGPIFWFVATQLAWTVALILWIVFLSRRERSGEGWGVLVAGIVLFALIGVGVTIMLIHLAREAARSRATKDFVSRVSHDLRSPLAIVKLYLQTLQLRELEPEKRETCVEAALVELGRLESGIEDVLTASRVDRQALSIAAEALELRGLLDEYAAAKTKEVAAREGRLEWLADSAPSLSIRGDWQLLRQLLDNLIDNAVVHAEPGVNVRLRLAEQAGCAVIAVQDDGPGLESHELKRVFRMFYRAARSRRHTRGTGLGLFIVAGIARAHGGRAWVESEGLGKGCLFQVALPLSKAA